MTDAHRPGVLVTGATGFIGQGLVRDLSRIAKYALRLGTRSAVLQSQDTVPVFHVGNVGPHTDWRAALDGVDCVIHTVGKAHAPQHDSPGSLNDYRNVNVHGTLQLARQAAAVGVRRMIFLSSVKVNGENTVSAPFTPFDTPCPTDAYGVSKWEAEQGLWDISRRTGMELVVVRPPLVYGPGVKGNLARLLRLVTKGVPLPLNAIYNKRSFVALANLTDLLVKCIEHPAAAGQTFMVSDGEDVSTPELIRRMAQAAGCNARLFYVPLSFLRVAAGLFGRISDFDRLSMSLQVDISHTRNTLGWAPVVKLDQGLIRMVSGVSD